MHMDDDLQNDLKQVMGEHGNSRLSRAGTGSRGPHSRESLA